VNPNSDVAPSAENVLELLNWSKPIRNAEAALGASRHATSRGRRAGRTLRRWAMVVTPGETLPFNRYVAWRGPDVSRTGVALNPGGRQTAPGAA
jgi:hypothetical protein